MSGSGPTFTYADVVQFVATHRPSFAVAGSPAPTVVSVQCMTAKEVSAQLGGEWIGVPDTNLLCLARLTGTFEDNPPYGIQAYPDYDGVIVFDARTGNMLLSSVG